MNLIDSLRQKVIATPAKWTRLRELLGDGDDDALEKHRRGMGISDSALKSMRAAVGDYNRLIPDAAQLPEREVEYQDALAEARENYDPVEAAVNGGGAGDLRFQDTLQTARIAFARLCAARQAQKRLALLRRNYPKLFAGEDEVQS